MDRRRILLSTIIVVLAVGALAWAFASKMQAPSSSHPEDDMTTYRNDTYGFEISYPRELATESSFRRYYALSDKWRAESLEEQKGTAIVAIPVFRIDNSDGVATDKPYPLYFTAEVRVGVSSDSQAVADCLKNDAGFTDQQHETVTLNGTKFEKFEFQDAAMMQYLQGVSYRTVRNNMCFAVEQVKAGSSYRDESMTSGTPDSELDAYFAQAGEMTKTIRFTK